MSSDFEGYEQDFAVLTAEITNKIARVPRLPPGIFA
ncbi:vesicle transport through interaction with t-SNAREs 1A [Rhinolophus ferrumequinum]|uniref:Vesicle transport through interaction with t-SNAREs 1A n=1 Tax=Rhinolophus ferrumequinum TaxID=59479 RepID=A0A7J7UYZ8_RHIFE|nr:vesicle transport through interaction with t-SNAREs 1A [Rhinolophus ferrumequinum]